MDLYELLAADEPTAQARAQALGRAMGLKEQAGLMAQLSGDRVLAPVGGSLLGQAEQGRAKLGDVLRQRQARALAKAQADAQAQQHQAENMFRQQQLAETGRHNRAAEAISSERPTSAPFQIVVGEGGAQFYADPRDPTKPAIPVMGPDGKPITKPKTQRPLQVGDKTLIDDLTGEIAAIDNLGTRFKDDFAGGGPGGQFATSLYQKLGSIGTKGMQEDAAFWADFNRLLDLPQRNKLFGASLSEGERTSWEGAKNVKPGSSPELVKAKLAEMGQIMRRKLGNIGDSLSEEGYDRDAIVKRTGGVYGAEPNTAAPAGPTVRRFTRQNGKLVEVK